MTAAFLTTLESTCQRNLLDTKWLLAPNLRIANQWKDQVNLNGTPTVNLYSATIQSVVLDLVAPDLATRNAKYASPSHCLILMSKVLMELAKNGELSYLSRVDSIEFLSPLITGTIADMRLNSVDIGTLTNEATEDQTKAADLRKIAMAYSTELESRGLLDYSDCLSQALEILDSGANRISADLIVICPIELPSCNLERKFIKQLETISRFVGPDPSASLSKSSQLSARFVSAVGEINEVTQAFQDIFGNQPQDSLDQVEILHTDYSTYVPLIHESLIALLDESNHSIDQLPVTFGEGLSCIYSRPGRALRAWVRWLRNDCVQSMIVRMVREGLLDFDQEDVGLGHASLSNRLRKLPIGFGANRYQSALTEAISDARNRIELQQNREGDSELNDVSSTYDFGLRELEALHLAFGKLIELSPGLDDDPNTVLEAAKQFLNGMARCANKLDQYAKGKLLDDITGMQSALALASELDFQVWDWLENVAVDSKILASGPRPGCIHVDHLISGGHSGRPRTFVVGMDDSRFPHRSSQDPLLLDFERRQTSAELPTTEERNRQAAREYRLLLSRLSGEVTFSFSVNNFAGDRHLFPGSTLLDTFREMTNAPTATLDDFLESVGTPASFCPSEEGAFVCADQWWHAKMSSELDEAQRSGILEAEFGHFVDARQANAQRASNAFTQFDGFVPAAGQWLDPTRKAASRISPSRLETFGTCPRKFFFRYALGIAPPDEHLVDSDQWLDALALGSLIHEVFEEFLREKTAHDQRPKLSRDLEEIHNLLHQKMETLKQTIPVPNQDAYQRQRQRLEKTCEIFLRREEEYCETTGAVPWVFEASIGLGDRPSSPIDCEHPVKISLSDGRQIQVGGRIDRVDRIGGPDSLDFAIWDYKSGSNWGFDAGDAFKQGRKLQPFLYAGMLKHRLRAEIDPHAKFQFFGYFFPSPKTEGLRMQWTTAELKPGDEIVRNICDAIAQGAFPATNEKADCKYCDYLPICGDADQTANSSLIQLSTCSDSALDPFRKLRSVELTRREES